MNQNLVHASPIMIILDALNDLDAEHYGTHDQQVIIERMRDQFQLAWEEDASAVVITPDDVLLFIGLSDGKSIRPDGPGNGL